MVVKWKKVILNALAVTVACVSFSSIGAEASAELDDLMKQGEPHFKERCAVCHDNPEDYIPPRTQLKLRSADYVINTLTKGSMYPHAKGLDEKEIKSIAVYVTEKLPTGSTINPDWNLNACKQKPTAFTAEAMHWNGWGRDLDNSRYQPNPGIAANDVKKLKVKWSFAYPNGRHNSQPVYVGNQVIVSAAPGRVYSLDADTGCTHWIYDTDSGVRATTIVGKLPNNQYAVFVGTTDRFIHAINLETGKRIWKTQVGELEEARVTGAPLLYNNKLYVALSSFEETAALNADYLCCRFRGNVVALDIASGKIDWRTYVIEEEPKQHSTNKLGKPLLGPAGAAIWSSPSIDVKRQVVYVATGDSYTDVKEDGSDAVIAMNLADGKIQWKNQVLENDNFLVGCYGKAGHANCPEELGPDYDFGSSVIIRQAGEKTILLAGQKSGIMYAMDADDKGKILWERKLGEGSALGGIQWGSAADEKVVYVPVTDTVVFDPKLRKPGLTALDIATGKTLWHTPAPAPECGPKGGRCGNGLSAAISVMPGAVFAGSLDGMLRAYSTADGSILWSFDTKQIYKTVNDIELSGGSINATGPTIANGMMFINSGYGGVMNAGGMSTVKGQDGNVLLAFSVDGK
ncbi:MAG: PQQ-binding-like beta-propeller repeat protein [Cellvibrionaceae bacterium]